MQVDVVYVGNLHVQHIQSVMMMFEAVKPVLCEKPMTTTVKDTASIIQAARGKGLFLMEVRITCNRSKLVGRPVLITCTATVLCMCVQIDQWCSQKLGRAQVECVCHA